MDGHKDFPKRGLLNICQFVFSLLQNVSNMVWSPSSDLNPENAIFPVKLNGKEECIFLILPSIVSSIWKWKPCSGN